MSESDKTSPIKFERPGRSTKPGWRYYIWQKDDKQTVVNVPMLEIFSHSVVKQKPMNKGPGFWKAFADLVEHVGGPEAFHKIVTNYVESNEVKEHLAYALMTSAGAASLFSLGYVVPD